MAPGRVNPAAPVRAPCRRPTLPRASSVATPLRRLPRCAPRADSAELPVRGSPAPAAAFDPAPRVALRHFPLAAPPTLLTETPVAPEARQGEPVGPVDTEVGGPPGRTHSLGRAAPSAAPRRPQPSGAALGALKRLPRPWQAAPCLQAPASPRGADRSDPPAGSPACPAQNLGPGLHGSDRVKPYNHGRGAVHGPQCPQLCRYGDGTSPGPRPPLALFVPVMLGPAQSSKHGTRKT